MNLKQYCLLNGHFLCYKCRVLGEFYINYIDDYYDAFLNIKGMQPDDIKKEMCNIPLWSYFLDNKCTKRIINFRIPGTLRKKEIR